VTAINWEQIRKEWESSDITIKELAAKHGVKDSTVRSRKSRQKWQRNATATPQKNVATSQRNATERPKPQKAEKEPEIKNGNLNEQQQLFCIYYTRYWNATKAYQKAYGVGYESAMRSGHRLLRKVEIKKEIERVRDEARQEMMLDFREVLQKYIDIAFADITDFVEFGQQPKMELVGFDEDKNPIYEESARTYNYFQLKDSDDIDGSILTEVKEGKEGITVKLADKMKALEKLEKYFDLLSDSEKEQLQKEKLKAETDLTKARTTQIQGEEKDTSKLQALLDSQKQFAELEAQGAFDEFKGDADD
jgi:phage terminase small subunit